MTPETLVGVWAVSGLAALVIATRMIVKAITDRPASNLDVYLAAIDDAIDSGRSRVVTFDDRPALIHDAVMEDAEVDWLERLYFEIPAAVK